VKYGQLSFVSPLPINVTAGWATSQLTPVYAAGECTHARTHKHVHTYTHAHIYSGTKITIPSQRCPVTKRAITNSGKWDKTIYCKALYDFYGDMSCDLQFKKEQRIAIVTWTESQDDWWERTVNDKTGIFPANYVLQLLFLLCI